MSKPILALAVGVSLWMTGAGTAAAATPDHDPAVRVTAPVPPATDIWVPQQGKGNGQGRGGEGSGGGGQGSRGGNSQAGGGAQGNRGGNAQARQGGPAAPGQGAAKGASNRGGDNAPAARADRPGKAAPAAARGNSSGQGSAPVARPGTGSSAANRAARPSTAGRDRVRIRGAQAAQSVLTRARTRGLPVATVDVLSEGSRTRIVNRRGETLFDWDDDRDGDLGYWRLRRLGDQQPRAGAPAFCRSGAGHPVWGREWCLDRGFGLGSQGGILWSRGTIEDVVFGRRTIGDRLDRGGLLDVLGRVILGRIALQALGLGYTEPLTGYWVEEPQGPRLLRVRSGDYEVAEFVDLDRDDRAEVLYVAQPATVVVVR